RVRDGGRQVAVFALRRPSGQPGGRRRTSRRNHGHDLRPAGPLSVVRQRQPRENRPPGHRCALPPGRASGQLQVGIPRHPDRRPDGGAGGVSGQLEDLKRGAAPFLPEPEFLFKAGLPTFVGSLFLFDAMGASQDAAPDFVVSAMQDFLECMWYNLQCGGKWGKVGGRGDGGMFMGEYRHSLDDKGRLFIPSKFREGLGASFVVTRGLDRCLFAYPRSEWSLLEQKLKSLPFTRADARAFTRFFFSGAIEAELDKQ